MPYIDVNEIPYKPGAVIGTCSICGGPVREWDSSTRCEHCHAVPREKHGPVIPMVPNRPLSPPYAPTYPAPNPIYFLEVSCEYDVEG